MAFTAASLKYLGGLIVPRTKTLNVTPLASTYPTVGITADSLGFGGRPFAIDQARREFVCGTRYGRVARLQMIEPAPHTDNNPETFPIAPYVSDVMVALSGPSVLSNPLAPDHSWWEMTDPMTLDGVGPSGHLPLSQDRILVQGQVYYDANNNQVRSAFVTNWPPVSAAAADYVSNRTPFKTMNRPDEQGLVAGYLCEIPEPWRERLKGDTLSGQAGLPIISRGSAGPCAYSFFAAHVQTHDPVPATMLVGYPGGHEMAGHPWDNPNPDEVYNFATMITGVAILGDRIVFVGSHGYGTPCYGNGTSDPSLEGQPDGEGSHWCYDPTASAKGNHAYPYRIQVWHYPLLDLADVVAGVKAPWDLQPEWFEIVVPFMAPGATVNGCAYDPQTNRFWLCAYGADRYGYEPGPIFYGFEFLGEAELPPEPPTDSEEIERLQKQVIALTLALGAEHQRHEATKATVRADAVVITDAAARILEATVPRRLR